MKLQLALDDITLEDALSLVRTVRDYIDIIEIGTPFVIEYGMEAVRVMKKEFPEKEILADLKIMDAGDYEAEEALKAGADYVTVLGVTDILTVKGCIAIVLGATFTNHYEIILPICAILISLSSIITGSIIRYTLFSGFPAFGIALGLNMLFSILDKTSSYLSLLEFVLVIVFALIIPGHILNYCARKDNKR